MKSARARSSLLALSILLSFTQAIRAEETVQNNGNITFFTDSGPCILPIPESGQSAVHKFPKKPPTGKCSSALSGGRIELRNVPSATKILFVNGRSATGQLDSTPKYCELYQDYGGSWNWYELLTIKNPTTIVETSQENAPHTSDLSTLQEGQVVRPGLRLIKKVTTSTNLAKPYEINCIRIERSPAVPTANAEQLDTAPSESAVKPAGAATTAEGPIVKNYGKISFHGDHHCTLDFIDTKRNFTRPGSCHNDDATTFELEHVPSASEIWLYDNPDCNPFKDNNFWFELLTIKNDYTLAPARFEPIASTPIGDVVRGMPGLRVIDSYVRPGAQIYGKLSCVAIFLSPQP